MRSEKKNEFKHVQLKSFFFVLLLLLLVLDFSGWNIFRCGSMPNPLMGFLTLRECPKILWMYVIVSVIIFIPCLPRRDIGSLRWPAVYFNVTRMKKRNEGIKKNARTKNTRAQTPLAYSVYRIAHTCVALHSTAHRTPFTVHHTVHASVHFARLLLLFFSFFSVIFFSLLSFFLYAIHIIRSFYNN